MAGRPTIKDGRLDEDRQNKEGRVKRKGKEERERECERAELIRRERKRIFSSAAQYCSLQ